MAQFEIGNKAAEKWTLDEVRAIFLQMLENACKDDSILCLQDAIRSVNLYMSSINYLIDKFPVFETLKTDINSVIISRINKGALTGEFNPTAAIWRMKQSGETDQQQINHQNNGGKFEPVSLASIPTSELIERAKAVKKIDD